MSDKLFREIIRKALALVVSASIIIFIGTGQIISALVCSVLIAAFYFWITGEFNNKESQ